MGGPLRTATIFSGSSAESRTIANRPAQPLHRAQHGVLEAVVLPLGFDQVCDDFGIGFGDELVALRLQLALELEIVLDDAVVDDDDPAGAVAVGMGVLFGGPAMRGPPRVAEAVNTGSGSSAMTSSRLVSLPGAAPDVDAVPLTTATPAES